MEQMQNLFEVIRQGPPWSKPLTGRFFLNLLLVFIGLTGFAFSLTVLFISMRGVLRLGGMVASGGPYAIAHPAPRWVWVVPTSIWLGAIFVLLYIFNVRRTGGLQLPLVAWSAVFLSLGYNFLAFAFRPPSGGFSIGWLICGVMFWIMGGLPLLPMLANLLSVVRNELRSPHYVAAAPPAAELEVFPGRVKGTALFILHTTAIVVGIGKAIRFFQAIE